jgi:hypothetical protein
LHAKFVTALRPGASVEAVQELAIAVVNGIRITNQIVEKHG